MTALKPGTDPIGRIFDFNYQVVGVPKAYDIRSVDLDKQTSSVHQLSDKETAWLHKALREESDELVEALYIGEFEGSPLVINPDEQEVTIGQVDACIDAAIFALGGLARMGLTKAQARACLDAVMDANFEKKAGVKPGRVVEGVKDAVKPEGWTPPEARIKEILYGNR